VLLWGYSPIIIYRYWQPVSITNGFKVIMFDSVIQSNKVVIGDEIKPAVIAIKNGLIAEVWPEIPPEMNEPVTHYGDKCIMPGIVDTHVHINEPGRTSWEGFDTATRAAMAGGVTT